MLVCALRDGVLRLIYLLQLPWYLGRRVRTERGDKTLLSKPGLDQLVCQR